MRRICIYTGTRAEYGLLAPLMKRIQEDRQLDLKVIASGMHLSSEFGLTYKLIEKDGFKIDEKIEILLSSDTSSGVCKSMGLAAVEYESALRRIQPDILVVLGDRFEVFSVVTCALVLNIPVAHIHGGEVTIGAMDDSFRHAITKMSHLHFACAEPYRQRIVQLGEHPDRVFNVGALGVENILNMPLLDESEIKKQSGINLEDKYFLVTFHPVTREGGQAGRQFYQVLEALSEDAFKDYKIIITKANADTDGRSINKIIDDFAANRKERVSVFTSMGQLRYLSAMKYASAVIGNSSSGILEAPSFKVPVINIGKRQKGRIKADNVLSCRADKKDIVKTIFKCLSKEFLLSVKQMKNPFEQSDTSYEIKEIIKNFDLSDITFKEFYDKK